MICFRSSKWVPVTAVAGEKPWLLDIFLISSDIIGNASNQLWFLVTIAVFSVRSSLPIIPFVWGWYTIVRSLWKPIIADRSLNSSLSNWFPRSVTMCNGTPKRESHVFWKTNAMVVEEVSCKCETSTHFVSRSIHVNTYLAGFGYTPS